MPIWASNNYPTALAEVKTNEVRTNINPSSMTDEAIEQPRASAYCDPLIYFQHDNYGNIVSRRMCMFLDPLISALTEGWANLATAKQFKFFSSHGVEGMEIMQEYRSWWKSQNLDEVLKACIPHFIMDGSVLLELGITKEGILDYEVYGSYECSPIHWYRDSNNGILWYNMQYTPMPRPFLWNFGGAQLHGVSKQYTSEEILHVTRGAWNMGLGNSGILPVWDSAVKLRTGSHADMFRRDIRFLIAVPEAWKDDKAQSFTNTLNDFLRSRRRAFLYRMEQAKNAEQTPLELPRFGFDSMAQPAPKPTSQSEAGGQLLRDPEWARFLSGCKHTENYFIGNQSGAVTGSEVDLTRDFYTECEEFSLLESLIKRIINWFVERGFIPPPPAEYVVKYWKDWEHQEMAAQMAEQEMQLKTQGANPQSKTNTAIERYNRAVELILFESIHKNNAMPMTPVKSSWIKAIGYDEGSIYMQVHDRTKQGIDTYEYNPDDLEGIYSDWVDSDSKGGFWWDTIRDVYSPAFKHGKPPSYLDTGYGGELEYAESEATREYKMKGEPEKGLLGAGTSREPYQLAGTSQTPTPAHSLTPFTPTSAFEQFSESTASHESILTPGYVRDPGSITGSKKVGPGRKRSPGKSTTRSPIVPYNLASPVNNERIVFNSAAALMHLAKDELNWGMSKTTAYNIMQLVDSLRKNAYRINSVAYGNGIKADHPMYYDLGGSISEEYICVDSYKKNIGKTVPLGIYHNRDKNSPELPEWQQVGTYTIKGWDEENGCDIAEIEYDEKRINEVFVKLKEPNWIQSLFQKGQFPDVSTAYYCDVVWKGNKNIQTNIDIKSVSFVPAGNCPGDVCSFETARENRWITKRGKHIWIDTHYSPEEFYEQFSVKERGKYLTKKEFDDINRDAELSPWLLIDKSIDIKTWGLHTMNRAMNGLPLKIKNMIRNVKVYQNGVSEDPYFVGRAEEIPNAYKAIGLERTWKKTGGVYISSENRAIIGINNEPYGSNLAHTLRHEVGHATWNHINEADRAEFNSLFRSSEKRVRDTWGDYEANDVSELFAESFARYWDAKTPGEYQQKQRQKIGWISKFFNTRMQKYFKEE